MEASENAGTPFEGSGAPALHRIDLDRVTRTLRDGVQTPGFARLQLMVGTILPRLADEGVGPEPDYGSNRSF
jgi:hypothetical protein